MPRTIPCPTCRAPMAIVPVTIIPRDGGTSIVRRWGAFVCDHPPRTD